jgi:hypothetical protein
VRRGDVAGRDLSRAEWRGLTFAPLRKRGHSKEGRDNDPQEIIALAVTRDSMPVRSWVLPGDTADITAVQRIKEDLRQLRLASAGRCSWAMPVSMPDLSLRSVGTFGPGWRQPGVEIIGFSARERRFWREKL